MDYNEEPAPAKTLKFIEKGFDLTPSPIAVPQPYDGNKRSRHQMHTRGVKLHKKSPGSQGKNETVSVQSRSWNGWRRCRYRNAERPSVRRRLAAAS